MSRTGGKTREHNQQETTYVEEGHASPITETKEKGPRPAGGL